MNEPDFVDVVLKFAFFCLAISACWFGIELYNEGRRLVRCYRVKREQQQCDREWAARLEAQRVRR